MINIRITIVATITTNKATIHNLAKCSGNYLSIRRFRLLKDRLRHLSFPNKYADHFCKIPNTSQNRTNYKQHNNHNRVITTNFLNISLQMNIKLIINFDVKILRSKLRIKNY